MTSTSQAPDRVRRVSVTDPVAAARPYDYADAFELRLEGPDRCSPEEWVRAGVGATPAWIKGIAARRTASARLASSSPMAMWSCWRTPTR